jgi:hypothetical protein
MGFVYEKRRAIDHERGITIELSHRFTDTFPELPYTYSGNGMEFVFFAIAKEEPRQWLFKGVWSERKLPVIVYILEDSLPRNLRPLAAKNPERDAKYASIKEDIRDGMFTLWTWGGKLLSAVPEFKVEFAKSIPDVKSIIANSEQKQS